MPYSFLSAVLKTTSSVFGMNGNWEALPVLPIISGSTVRNKAPFQMTTKMVKEGDLKKNIMSLLSITAQIGDMCPFNNFKHIRCLILS